MPWEGQYIDIVGGTSRTRANQVDLTLANVASLTIDLGGACIGSAPLSVHVTSNRPVVIRFSDGRSLTVHSGTHRAVV